MEQEQRSILIVSEDYSRLRAGLREAGFATAGLPDAESARVIFDSLHPVLVVCDVELSSNDRRSLPYFVRIMSRHPRTPMVAIADHHWSQDDAAPPERFDAVLHRPVHVDDLTRIVNELLSPDQA